MDIVIGDLPTMEELVYLKDITRWSYPAIDTNYFDIKIYGYWSDTIKNDNIYPWGISFKGGYDFGIISLLSIMPYV